MSEIFVMGAGSFGTALSVMLFNSGHRVSLWGHNKEHQEEIARTRENKKLLKGIIIPSDINVTYTTQGIEKSDFVFIATPTFAVRETARLLKGRINSDTIIVSVSKGLEQDSLKLLNRVIREELPENPEVCLSGPSHAEEISQGMVTALVAASENHSAAVKVQGLTENTNVRIYTSEDIIGVQLGGALKNIVAFSAGIADGLSLGDNTKAALMTRGLAEITRLGVKMGANPETFLGLAGVGDLIVTCCSVHSRNHRCGELVGMGKSAGEAATLVGMVVEGITATRCAVALSQKLNIEMPIAQMLNRILNEEITAEDGLSMLLERPLKGEHYNSSK